MKVLMRNGVWLVPEEERPQMAQPPAPVATGKAIMAGVALTKPKKFRPVKGHLFSNNAIVDGAVTIIEVVRESGAVMRVLIDTADWDLVNHACSRVYVRQDKARDVFYAMAGLKSGRYTQLSRIILNAPDGMVVDHRNADGLDNRRGNLRVCTLSENMQNRRKRLPKNQWTEAPLVNTSLEPYLSVLSRTL